jgi:hypothetical protein
VEDELARRYRAVEDAERALREHREAGYRLWLQDRPVVGMAPLSPFTDAWREEHRELKSAFDRAHAAWMSYLPLPQ